MRELYRYPWKFITRYGRFFNVIHIAIYARMHETGPPAAWSAGRCHKHVENHRARCVIDPRCCGYRAIAYRAFSSWYLRESRTHFSHSLNTVNAIIIVEIAESSVVEYKWKFITEHILTCPLLGACIFWSFSPLNVHFPLFFFLVLVISNEYARVTCCTCQPIPWVTLRFIEIPPFHSGMGCRKLQVNSLRAAGMKATIQRFNEAHRSGGWEWVVTRTRNNARLREEKAFSV